MPILSSGLRRSTALDRDLHQLSHGRVEGDEGVVLDDSLVGILAEEAAGIVAAQAERRLSQIVGAEGEELRALADLAGHEAGSRKLDHGADRIGDARAALLLDGARGRGDALLDEVELALRLRPAAP